METSWNLLNLNMTLSVSNSVFDDPSTQSPSTLSSSPYCSCIGHNTCNSQRYEPDPFETAVDASSTFDQWSTIATPENMSTSSDSEAEMMTGSSGINQDNYQRSTGLGGNNWFPTQSIGSYAQYATWGRSQPSLDTVHHHSVEPLTEKRQKQKKSKESLVPVVAMAILSHFDRRMALKDINEFIASRGDRSLTDKPTWKNNVRHVLSHYEFFVKNARVASGAGYYWSIHPACLSSFSAGDFSIKKARHAVQQFQKMERLNRDYHQQLLQQQQPCLSPTNPEVRANGPRSPGINHMHS